MEGRPQSSVPNWSRGLTSRSHLRAWRQLVGQTGHRSRSTRRRRNPQSPLGAMSRIKLQGPLDLLHQALHQRQAVPLAAAIVNETCTVVRYTERSVFALRARNQRHTNCTCAIGVCVLEAVGDQFRDDETQGGCGVQVDNEAVTMTCDLDA